MQPQVLQVVVSGRVVNASEVEESAPRLHIGLEQSASLLSPPSFLR